MGKKGNINFTPSMYIVVYTYFLIKVTLSCHATKQQQVPRDDNDNVPKGLEKDGQRVKKLYVQYLKGSS